MPASTHLPPTMQKREMRKKKEEEKIHKRRHPGLHTAVKLVYYIHLRVRFVVKL